MLARHASSVLSLVERGWQASRLCSLELAKHQITVTHLIKGSFPTNVYAIITPHQGISVRDYPKMLFWPVVWLISAAGLLHGNLRAVLVDNERSFKRMDLFIRFLFRLRPCRKRKAPIVVLAISEQDGYRLIRGGAPISQDSWYHALGLAP